MRGQEEVVASLAGAVPATGDRIRLAVAALLLEAARFDPDLAAEDRSAILRLVRDTFVLDEGEVKYLVDEAGRVRAVGAGDRVFTRTVREAFSPAQRGQVIRMLWQVAFADGRLQMVEEDLVMRIARALDVAAEEATGIKRDVLRMLGGGKR